MKKINTFEACLNAILESKIDADIDSHENRSERGREANTVEQLLAQLEEVVGSFEGYQEFNQVRQQLLQALNTANQIFEQEYRPDQLYYFNHRRSNRGNRPSL